MRIPLHSVVFNFTSNIISVDEHELVSLEKIKKDLLGDDNGYYNSYDFIKELRNRIIAKLWLGQRVIINSLGFKKIDREFILDSVSDLGVQIFYILDENIIDRDLIKGDDRAEVVSFKKVNFAQQLNPLKVNQLLNSEYKGITVVGDVHGQLEPLLSVISWASKRNSLLVFLGDIIDFGPKSIECIEEVYKLVVRNKAILILGNHERKIYKWVSKYSNKNIKLYLSESNKKTIEQIKKLSPLEKKKWEFKFKALINLSHTHFIFKENIFIHAAFKSEMMEYSSRRILPPDLEKIALFGEVIPQQEEESKIKQSYSWIEELPLNYSVFIGHEPKDLFSPVQIKNKRGNTIYFMDTGSGKGGSLSSADLILNNGQLILQNFNHW